MDTKRILIVDDDPNVRKSLFDIMKGKGYTPIAAATGKTVIDMVKKQKFNVALIDLKLEDISGLEVMKEIKECCPGTECVVLTGYASKESAIEAVNLGAYGYVQKPYDMEQLLVTIQRAIEKQESEEALRDSEEKYRSLVESTEDSIYLLDRDCRYLFMNQRRLSRFGMPIDEVIGRAYGEFHSKEETKEFSDKVKEVFETGKSLWHEYRSENDGGYFLRTLSPVKEPDGRTTSVTVVSKNITELKIAEEEKKKLEAQFQAAQRMEAMGTLAGGIAHDFNNILMGIQGNTSLVLLNKTSEHPDYERLKGIEQGVQSGAELTRQLLGFARSGKYEVRPTDLNELIKNQNRMFGRTKKEITIRGRHEDNIWTVEVDQGQIGQVLLNLYVNAWQAMPAGGDLYIQTENVTLDEDYAKPFTVDPGRYVKISVTDTGVGMDEATRQRIFDPFFTTKEMGKGTGLGLASVHGIVRNHGGIINVYSEKGEGTTFNIYLPAAKKKVVEDKESVGEILKGSEGILLVDDEDMIIDVGVGILTELGYKVLLARGGKEAIDIYNKNKDNIDMVILDMIMPGVGGGETYDRMKKINPDIKVLLSSGYSINGQATEIVARGCDGFIQKPFNMRELSQEVRKVLDKE